MLTAYPTISRYLTRWRLHNFKNSLKSSGSSFAIVHPSQKFERSQTCLNGLLRPERSVAAIRLFECRYDKFCAFEAGHREIRGLFRHSSVPWRRENIISLSFSDCDASDCSQLDPRPQWPQRHGRGAEFIRSG